MDAHIKTLPLRHIHSGVVFFFVAMLQPTLGKSVSQCLFVCCQQHPPSTRVLLTDIDWVLLVKLYAPPQQTHIPVYFHIFPFLRSAKLNGACLARISGPRALKRIWSRGWKEIGGKKSPSDLGKREVVAKSVSICIRLGVFVCVAVRSGAPGTESMPVILLL